MNSYEEELQKSLENGDVPQGVDGKAYREVFRALKKEPEYQLPPDFARRVLARLQSRQESKVSRDYFWFFAGMFFLIIALLGTLLFTGFRFDFGFLNGMKEYSGFALFAVGFVLFLNWLDKRLVRERFMHEGP
jgi:hypothetical protein